jgi:hypothetical protein
MWKCKKCNEEVEDNFNVCWNCGSDKKGSGTSFLDTGEQTGLNAPIEEGSIDKIESKNSSDSSKSKYPSLIIISKLINFFAVFLIIDTIVAAILYFVQLNWFISLSILIGGSIIGLILMGISRLILVLLDIEYNTRKLSKQK